MTKNEIIHTYIEKHLLNDVYPKECPHPYKLWCRNGVYIFMYMESYMLLQVKLSVWNELHDMFSLTGEETDSLLKGWAMRNLGLTKSILIIATNNFI